MENKLSERLSTHAAYLRTIRLPVSEREAIEKILSCAASLENIAKEMESHEDADQQG